MSANRRGGASLPVLVTRAEVLEYFAREAERMALTMSLASDLSKDKSLSQAPLLSALIELGNAALPAPDLQIAAAQNAAKLMRDVAREDRILAARAAADQVNKEPTRG